MRRQTFSTFLMVCGALMMLVGISLLPAQRVALANAPQAAPSARPPIASTPERPRRDRGGGGDSPTAVVLGHITGTVIDQTTGAPAPGITVNVGGSMVVTDKNGNYESPGIPAGNYGVILMLVGDQGQSSQGIQTVRLESGARVVLHLAFRSAQQAPASAPTSAPTSIVPTTELPTTVMPIVAQPIGQLPNTGEAPLTDPKPAARAALEPSHLPRTSGYAGESWAWLIAGAALLVAGAGLRPVASRWIAAARETPLVAALAGPRVAAQPLTLREIARTGNLLLVGQGQQTQLLRRLIRLRAGTHIALDLSTVPQPWPCRVVGTAGVHEAERYLRAAVVALRERQQALAHGAAVDTLQPITVVVEDLRPILGPGDAETAQALHTLLAEGHRVGRYLLAAACSDSPRELGMASRSSMLAGFEYVVYLGAEAVRRLPSAATQAYPAVAYRTRGNVIAQLEIPTLTPEDELLAELLET